MINSPTMIGLYIGIFTGAALLVFMLLKFKKAPEFMHGAVIILSCTGAIMGLHLGFMSLTVTDQDLGSFADQRVAIVLGALAVTWTAVETLINTFKQAVTNA